MLERLFQLIQRVDLDLDLHKMTACGENPFDRRRNAPGRSDVIVLDEDSIEETEPVVESAACPNSVFLESAETRRRLARTDNAGVRPSNGLDKMAGGRGDAGETLQEIESDTFRRKDSARLSA